MSIWCVQMIMLILLFLWVFLLTVALLFVHIKLAWKFGFVSPDAHKEGNPKVANLGGLVLFLLPAFLLPAYVFFSEYSRVFLGLIVSTYIGLFVGLVDDFKSLGLKKAGIVALAGLPLLLLGLYEPHPYIPLIGTTRMTIIYPLFVLAIFSVFADASNMVDVFNGVLVGQGLAIFAAFLFVSVMYTSSLGLILSLVGLGYSLGFLVWNRYPAKVFHGNVGAYGYGSLISATIVLMALEIKGIEFVAIIAFLPAIFNGFLHVFRTGFAPRDRLKPELRPVQLDKEKWVIKPNLREDSGINLTKLLVSVEQMNEKQLIRWYYTLFFVSMLFAILTGYLIFVGFV